MEACTQQKKKNKDTFKEETVNIWQKSNVFPSVYGLNKLQRQLLRVCIYPVCRTAPLRLLLFMLHHKVNRWILLSPGIPCSSLLSVSTHFINHHDGADLLLKTQQELLLHPLLVHWSHSIKCLLAW